MKVRFNFSISVQLSDRLSLYCSTVGRTPTDLIRQLILEYLDNEIPLPDLTPLAGPEKRTSILLPDSILRSFGAKADAYAASKGRIVSGLVLLFLGRRRVYSDVYAPDYKKVLEDLVGEILETPLDWDYSEVPPALGRAIKLLKKEMPDGCRS